MNKLRVLDVPWHIGHQYEMLKFPWIEWSWLFQHRREYNTAPRGDLEKYFKWVTEYKKGEYDLAILHLDQQCIEEGILERGKGSVYRHMNEAIQGIPKIVIMHGTPYYPEMYADSSIIVEKIKELVGDNPMVVNSHRAAEQWGWGTPIIHGMDPKEWWDLPKEPRVVTMISPGGLPSYYDRTFLENVREGLEEKDIQHCHITVDWSAKNWDDYRNFLGRSLIYFNPTRESPMPRSRTEAMLSGSCVITTPHQDADKFIVDGYNGFLVKRNPAMVVDLICKLLDNYKVAIEVGQKGKQTAIERFGWDRYEQDWKKFITQTIEDYSLKNPDYVKPTLR